MNFHLLSNASKLRMFWEKCKELIGIRKKDARETHENYEKKENRKGRGEGAEVAKGFIFRSSNKSFSPHNLALPKSQRIEIGVL